MAIQAGMSAIGWRHKLYQEIEPQARTRRGLSFTNGFIVFLVIASLITFAMETEPTLSPGLRLWIDRFNLAIVGIFAFEYFVRLVIAGEDPRYRGVLGRLRYIATPYAVADLLAFAPELLWVLLAPSDDGGEILMGLRILRLARLVKIARFMPAFDVLGAALQRAGGQLLTTLALALALVYVSAVALYLIEGVANGVEAFASIPRAVWWAIATLTTVGYGDVYPVTVLGRVAASVIAIAGIGVVALPAGVFASAFSDELRAREAARRDQVSDD
ncbi:MAG: ion transporter [Pseudomonadota bacterium]